MTEKTKDQSTVMSEEMEKEETKKNESVDADKEETQKEIIEQTDDEVNTLKQTIDELQNKLLRVHADFDNFRKRTRLEKEETAKYAAARLVEALLPAYDNLQRAVSSSKETQNFESLVQGIEMVYRQIEQVLNQEGLQPIEAVGQPFNPELHQAVMQVQTDEYESGVVVEELQKGYKFKDKVLRPSMVKVNA
ncbi:nucleotide exchange factor GrpE [Tepidibacillus fermentans]|uniref:Protein GrpE n=1 Tax=Tepidibacillus fermentans TaxID=1281767 RepID=A0A4R3KK41_9BACI|nr:nucleotide exchange factor GrpE [Tepidibacillus fermentans]TCS83745.1 molecular chaperone GrpE [Tepidibacillus fermentans]